MSPQDFENYLAICAQAQGWRPISKELSETIQEMSRGIPEETLLKLFANFMEQPNQQPAHLLQALRQERRLHKEQSEARPQWPAIKVTDESVKFLRRMGDHMEKLKSHGCPYGGCKTSAEPGKSHCFCFAEMWAEPLSKAETATPAEVGAAVVNVLGDPGPDPKPDQHRRIRHAA